MAARRSLGGGRILGSGRSLSPAVAARAQHKHNSSTHNNHNHTRNTSLLSPSESSISLSSQTSTTPISSETEDLTSRVALDNHHGPATATTAAASASSRLMCPICNEDMVGIALPLLAKNKTRRARNSLTQSSLSVVVVGHVTSAEQVIATPCRLLLLPI